MENGGPSFFLLIFLSSGATRISGPGFGTGRYARSDRFCSRRGITIRFIGDLQPAEGGEGAERVNGVDEVLVLADLKMRQWCSDGPRGAIDDSET